MGKCPPDSFVYPIHMHTHTHTIYLTLLCYQMLLFKLFAKGGLCEHFHSYF